MAITFALRGTSLTARYSNSGSSPGFFYDSGNGVPALLADAGAFGGSCIDARLTTLGTTRARAIVYPGLNNTSANSAITILIRYAPNYSGAPATSSRGIWYMGAGRGDLYGVAFMRHNVTTGRFYILFSKYNNNNYSVDYTTTNAWTPTAGTYYDIMFSWDGTTSANSAKISIDGVEFETFTPTAARVVDVKTMPSLVIGGSENNGIASIDGKISEFIIWDTAETHTYTARTNFYTVSSFDGTSYTNPGATNVANGVTYTFAGTSYTGSLVAPTPASGTAGTVDLNNIKEQIRYVLNTANVVGGSPIDLSNNLSARVKTIMKVNPQRIRIDANLQPCVTVFTKEKNIVLQDISKDQVIGRRKAEVIFNIMGIVWNDSTTDYKEDSADEDCEQLMENIEKVLRHYADLDSNVNWQFPTGVEYHTATYDEQTHMRIGVLTLKVSVFY